MKNNIQIIIGSPLDYEELVAYIYIDEQCIALVSQDEGKDKLKIEFYFEGLSDSDKKVDYDAFIEALQKAKSALLQ